MRKAWTVVCDVFTIGAAGAYSAREFADDAVACVTLHKGRPCGGPTGGSEGQGNHNS
jgi:hypothetical protein